MDATPCYNTLATAAHERQADARQSRDEAIDRIERDLINIVAKTLAARDWIEWDVPAGAIQRGQPVETHQRALEAVLEVIDTKTVITSFRCLVASEAGKHFRMAVAEAHAGINASIIAEARGLA